MSIPIKNEPQLLGNCQNHMSVSDTRLQYATDPRHKIIRVPLEPDKQKRLLHVKATRLRSLPQNVHRYSLYPPSSFPQPSIFWITSS